MDRMTARKSLVASTKPPRPAALRAELAGDNVCRCDAHNLSVRSGSPVIALCRLLIDAGIDPATRLEVFRGSTLALHVRSIGEAAKLRARDAGFELDRDGNAPAESAYRVKRSAHRSGTPAARKRFSGLPSGSSIGGRL